ncbi:MAG: hypothetical protein HW383_416, partial [Candidatus Magasanikbacteria bacterium]|nr:hypothetical protein [Candidatus Magasanikbacteria bacterium]
GEFGRAWQNIYTSGTIRVGTSSTISNTAIAYTGELTVSSTATTTIIGSAGSDATGNAAIILRSNGTLATADLLRIQEDSSAIPVVTINAAENFGIATSTPGASAKFGVNGDVFVGGNFTVTGTCTGCGGGAGFTDNGTTVTLTTITDKVGVGTSTPYGKLSINSETASNVGLVVSATSSQSANLSEWYDASGVLQMTVIAGGGLRASSTFQAGGEVRHYADTYLGDATTTDVTYVKSYLGDSLIPTSNGILDLGKSGTNYWNNVYSQFLITSNNQSTTTISGATLTFAGAATGTITGSPVTDGAGNAAIIIRSSSALASADLLRIQEDANATPVVTINSSENFGIATSSPGASAKLGVNGDVFIGGNITFTGACTGCGNSTGWTKSGSNVSLITGADFVGVGSSTPFGKLSVQAGADTDRVLVLKGNSATQTANLTEWYTGGGVKQMIVDPSGNLYSSSSIYSSVTSTMAALMVGPVNTSTPYAKMTIYQQNNVGLVLGQPTATSAGGDYLQVIDGNGVVYMRITTGSGSARGQLDLTGGTGAIKLNTGGLLFSDGSTIAISTNLTLTSNTALVNIPDGINQTGTGTNSFDGNSFTIGDAVTDTFTVTSRVNSSFIPSTDGDNSLGYPNLRWKHLNVGDPSYTASSGSTSTIEISTTVNGSASALGFIKGINALVQNNQGTAPGTITEVFGADILANFGTNAAAHSTSTYGIRARANYTNAPVGKIDYLYGGWFSASSTSGTGITNYGIYASSTGAATNWAGFFSGNTSLGQVTSTDITNFSSRISTSLIPVSNNQLDFGEGSRAWRDLFASGTIRVGTVINGITWNNGTFTGNASDTVGQIDTRFTIDTAQNGTENDEILRLSSLGTARLIIVATSTDRVLFRNNAFNAAGAQAYVFDTVNSFTSGTDRMLVSFRNAGTPEVSISAGGNVYANNSFIANATGSGLGDVAEYVEMAKNETAEVGDVLVADLKEPNSYRRSDKKHMAEVAGVVTDTGRFIIGSNTTGSRVPLALAGFVKVKVTDENGPIKAGDILVTSSKNGYAMKYDDKKDDSNMVGVLGVAVEDLKTVEGKIVVLIKTGWVNSRATTLETLAQDVVALGEATGVKIKTSSSGILNTSETASGTLASTSGQDLMNGSIINVKAIASASGKWSISDDGRIVSAEVVTDDVMTKKLSVKQDADKTKSTIGNATLTAGSGDVTVQNELVTDNTRVFVTFRNNPGGTYWISKQGSGYFELSVSKVPDVDAVFDYWLVDVILPEIPLTPTSTLLAAPVEATVTDTTATSTVATDTTASSTPVSASLPAPADTTSSTPIADISESPPADTASSTPISTL